MLAVILILDLRFSRVEAIVLAALFLGQFLFTSTAVRYVFVALYLVLSLVFLVRGGPDRRRQLFSLLLGRPYDRGSGST